MTSDGGREWFSPRRRTAAGAGVVLAAVLLSGCSGQTGSAADDPSGREHSIGAGLPEVSGGSAPVTLEKLNPSQQLFLFKAEEELTRRCMVKAGFDYVVSPVTVEDFTPRYLTADELAAAGYRLEQQIAAEGSTEGPNDAIRAKLTPERQKAWTEALFGYVPNDDGGASGNGGEISMKEVDGSTISTSLSGCVSEARAQLYGSLEGYLSYTVIKDAVNGPVTENLMWADVTYQATAAKWRSCMTRHGVTVDEHADNGRNEVKAAYLNKRPGVEEYEHEVLEADIVCIRETKIDSLRNETLDRIGREQIERNQLNVAGASVFEQQALVRARKLLSESPAG
jgi:hypothetical protein